MSTNKISLPIMEHFYTIQGEGAYSGRPAYFIRLEGCDVGCVWCDVKESWEIQEESLFPIKDLVSKINDTPTEFCVITGGEPCMHDLKLLTKELKKINQYIAIETSGCYPLIGNVDWYTFSPKKFKSPIDEAYQRADELKIVISHPSDFDWAESHAKKVSSNCKLYLQPEWSKQERFLPLIIEYVKNNPKWTISLQTHKIINVP